METKVLLFGAIAEHCGDRTVSVNQAENTDDLMEQLYRRFPMLATLRFAVSVDRRIVHSNTRLNSESEVALLPPFSGG